MKIALLGYGTVGGGVYELLKNREDVTIKYVLDRELHPELGEKSVTDYAAVLADGEVDTVVELIGGLEPSYGYITAAMKAGKNVVTANKYLLATYYKELAELSAEKGVSFRTGAAVGGGIPWLSNLERVKRTAQISEISGIMNGTTNYILDTMHKKGYDFDSVLKDAQDLGYAEADPSADIDGLDIQRKCIISANVAFDTQLSDKQVPAFGIRSITTDDIAGFKDMGYVCKLYASARRVPDNAVSVVVEPTLFPAGMLEASVPANFNLITCVSEFSGRQSFFGQGAGRFPTANAVVEDLLDLTAGYRGFYTDTIQPINVNNVCGPRKYYVRYTVDTWFMDGCVEARWGNGMITRAITPAEIHAWYAEAKKNDPDIFFAAITG